MWEPANPPWSTAKKLIENLRRTRKVPNGIVPRLCILEFDGDLMDWLLQEGIAKPFPSRVCFHTSMFAMELEGLTCAIIARTIGGRYAVLIAEQLQAAGAKIIIGLTSAGRLAPDLPLPCLVVAAGAIRDEGTAYHYLPPGREVACPAPLEYCGNNRFLNERRIAPGDHDLSSVPASYSYCAPQVERCGIAWRAGNAKT